MQGIGFKPKCHTFAVVASYAHLGQHFDTCEYLQRNGKKGVKANEVLYKSLIRGLAETGQFEEAF